MSNRRPIYTLEQKFWADLRPRLLPFLRQLQTVSVAVAGSWRQLQLLLLKLPSWCTSIFLIFSLVHAPGEVVGSPGSPVLLHQLLHHLPAVVQLVKVVLKSSDAISSKLNNITNIYLEHGVFSELVNEGLPLPQFVIVSEDSFKQAGKYEMALGILFY